MKIWFSYNLTVGFAIYWASNLLLWFPWSYSSDLGMILMLTVSPVIWSISSFYCLKSYPFDNLKNAAIINGLVFLIVSIVIDYVFFGVFRNALDELYHPTTFYGYAFVLFLPFIIISLGNKKISRSKKIVNLNDFVISLIIGFVCFGTLMFIIVLRNE